jgi:hypothetical protein
MNDGHDLGQPQPPERIVVRRHGGFRRQTSPPSRSLQPPAQLRAFAGLAEVGRDGGKSSEPENLTKAALFRRLHYPGPESVPIPMSHHGPIEGVNSGVIKRSVKKPRDFGVAVYFRHRNLVRRLPRPQQQSRRSQDSVHRTIVTGVARNQQALVDTALDQVADGGDPVKAIDALVCALLQTESSTLPLGRKIIGWIENALGPARQQLDTERYERLVSALTIIIGWEAMIVLRDLRGLDAQREQRNAALGGDDSRPSRAHRLTSHARLGTERGLPRQPAVELTEAVGTPLMSGAFSTG